MHLVLAVGIDPGPALQAVLGDLQDPVREIAHRAAAERRLQTLARHRIAQLGPLGVAPVLDQVPGRVQGRRVVEQSDPERRQGAEPAPGPAVRPAHLEKALQAHLGKERREMVGPVRGGRLLAGQGREPPLEKIAERLPAGVEVLAVAIDEVHGHVEHVVGVALEAHAVLEHEGQHAAAVRVGVGPEMAAVAEEAVRLALGEGRVREQRGGDRLQRQADPELAHHVGLAGEIQVDLHRAAPGHHVEAQTALLRHVLAHDLVAPLGHPGDRLARPLGLEAEAKHADAQGLGDLPHLGQVSMHLVAGLVDRLERRAGQLELAARLQGDAAGLLGQRDDPAVLAYALPAEGALHAGQQRLDAAFALVGQRAEVVLGEAELLVLGADAPVGAGLAAGLEIGDELRLARDRLTLLLGRG